MATRINKKYDKWLFGNFEKKYHFLFWYCWKSTVKWNFLWKLYNKGCQFFYEFTATMRDEFQKIYFQSLFFEHILLLEETPLNSKSIFHFVFRFFERHESSTARYSKLHYSSNFDQNLFSNLLELETLIFIEGKYKIYTFILLSETINITQISYLS